MSLSRKETHNRVHVQWTHTSNFLDKPTHNTSWKIDVHSSKSCEKCTKNFVSLPLSACSAFQSLSSNYDVPELRQTPGNTLTYSCHCAGCKENNQILWINPTMNEKSKQEIIRRSWSSALYQVCAIKSRFSSIRVCILLLKATLHFPQPGLWLGKKNIVEKFQYCWRPVSVYRDEFLAKGSGSGEYWILLLQHYWPQHCIN